MERPEGVTQGSGTGNLVGGRRQAGRTLEEVLAGRRPKQKKPPFPFPGVSVGCPFSGLRAWDLWTTGLSGKLIPPIPQAGTEASSGLGPGAPPSPQEASEIESMRPTHLETFRLSIPLTGGLSSPSD